jgi:ABC-type transport system substrate-binding protein
MKMKKILHNFYMILILSTLLIPIFPVIAAPKTAQDDDIVIKGGYAAGEPPRWDPAHFQANIILSFYSVNCLEKLINIPDEWDGTWDDLLPGLATGWTVEWWTPDADHSGGVKAINFTLRSGVTFHDGSAWNSTVAAWNINRTIWLSGGFGAGAPGPNMQVMWFQASDFAPYFTPEWDLSWAIGQPATYGGLINSVPAEGMNGWVSWINRTITYGADPLKLRIEFNAWNPKPFAMLGYQAAGHMHRMISMETYATNYTLTQIPGFSSTDVAHYVGTGPYKFVAHSDIGLGGGSVIKNDDWWNATAMQALGFHEIDEFKIVYYPLGAEGEEARQLALMSGELDIAADLPSQPLDYAQIIASPNHEYIDSGVYDRLSPAIFLNCVNESAYWTNQALLNTPLGGGLTVRDVFGNPDGIPRPIRQALSYSYDYNTFINTELEGRAVRAGGTLGVENEYYNSSVPLPDTDLTVARAKMLAAYPINCSDRGLNASSPSADWIHFGETFPIWTGEFHYDDRFEEIIGYMLDAAHQIGCHFDTVYHPNGLWADMQAGLFPFLKASAYCLNLPIVEVNIILYLLLYYKSANLQALAQARTRNFPFLSNNTINGYLFDIYLNNETRKQETFNTLAYEMQNVLCPMIYGAQVMLGIGHTKEWEVYLGSWDGAWIKHTDWDWVYPSEVIPGFQIPIIGFFSMLAMLGVIYVIKRKRKII